VPRLPPGLSVIILAAIPPARRKDKKGILRNAAYGEVCVARIGDFVCRVDHLQGAHELDRRENRAQTLRIIVMIQARQPADSPGTGNLPLRTLFSTLDSDPH